MTTWQPTRWSGANARFRSQFGTCCPTCPDGGRTVLYHVDGRGQIHRCIAAGHEGPRQHRDPQEQTA